MSRSSVAVRNLATVLALLSIMLVSAGQWRGGATAHAAGTITGVVFQDYNGNGRRDLANTASNAGGGTVALANDRGIAGVTITAYNADGAIVGSTASVNDGSYSLPVTGSGPYRVEFTNLPTNFQPGPVGLDNGSTVQFVPDLTPQNEGAGSRVNLGLIIPGEYCQDNPTLVTSCYKKGSSPGLNEDTLISFPYSAGSQASTDLADYRLPPTGLNVLGQVVGSTWGLAHSSSRQQIYAAAFFKKHIILGPGLDGTRDTDDDTGAIYVLDQSSGNLVATFSLPSTNPRLSFPPLSPAMVGVDPYFVDGYDLGWDAVGKYGLGGMALSDDEALLYVMNLENRTLYALDATTGAVVASQAVPGVDDPANAPLLPTGALRERCAVGDIRPFAVSFDRGQLYVGLTCTAESSTTVDEFIDSNGNGRFDHNILAERNAVTDNDGNGVYNTGDVRELAAYVYRVDPSSLAFESTPALSLALGYPRGIADTYEDIPAAWRPWTPGFDRISLTEGPNDPRFIIYPQPWLTDISFDNGNMVLGLRDRTGDTIGYYAFSNPNEPNIPDYLGIAIGDVLRACGDPTSGWTLENNGSCGGITTTPRPSNRILQPQGPGGGEYYFDDSYGIRGQDSINQEETSSGGGLQVPGYPDVVISGFDAFPFDPPQHFFNGGFRWYNNTTGAYSKAFVVYDTPSGLDPATLGKANGLGDLIALCDEAPIEIGNLVWRDDDRDGIQDPNEPPIAGVTVELYELDDRGNTTLIGTAITDANGNYIFSAYANQAPVTSGDAFKYNLPLKPNTRYEVRIPNASGDNQQTPLSGLVPTVDNNDPSSNGTIRDSDGIANGTAVRTILLTSNPGFNNHTYDFGFNTMPTAITLASFTATREGERIVLRWTTSLELEALGFNLYRSSTGLRADAVQINPQLIPALGRGSSGASYNFIDQASATQSLSYWIELVSSDAPSSIHGPATTRPLAQAAHQLHLPLMLR